MNYKGDFRLGKTIDLKFTTVNPTGVPTTLAGTPAIAAYVGNGTTEITAGITLTVDFDGRAGYHNVRIVASSGNGFATQTDVSLVITAGTVGGNSVVGYEIGSFSIENRSGLMPTTADRTLDVSAGGESGLDWANIGSPTTAQTLSGTSTKALEPTTADRTLDVTATGAAGIDWGNVENPTTTINFSNTTIGVVALLNALAANVITATSIQSNALTAAKFASGAFDAVWTVTVRTLSAFGFSVTVGTNNDKTGYTLSSAGVQAIWDALTSALTTVGSIGKLIVDNLNATITSRASQTSVDDIPTNAELAAVEATLQADIAGVQTVVDSLDTRTPAALVGGRTDASVGAYQSGQAPLQPTVAGRTIDVTAGGAAGVDWGNVENQGTTVGLSGTTVKTATDVATAVAAVPAAVMAEDVEDGVTVIESLRLANAANGGKLSGAATASVAIRNLADDKTRVAASVDADGNRTAVSLDLS